MIGPDSPLTPEQQPLQPENKSSGGWFSGISGWFISNCMEHEAPSTIKTKNISIEKYNPLITDFSKQITDGLVKEKSYLQPGQESIQKAIEDLLLHIFHVWSTESAKAEDLLPTPENEPAEQAFINILTLCTRELSTNRPREEQFKSIASQILNETFPDREHDEHFPSLVRDVLSQSGVLYYAVSYLKPEFALDWDGFIDLTAKSLQGIYEKFLDTGTKTGILETLEKDHPGAGELIEFSLQSIEKKAKEPINIASFSKESNQLLNTIVQKFSKEESVVIQKTKVDLREKVKENMAAVLSTVFECTSQAQTPEARRHQIADELITATISKLPQLHKQQMVIKEMRDVRVISTLNALSSLNVLNQTYEENIDLNKSAYEESKKKITTMLVPIRTPGIDDKTYNTIYKYYQPQIESVLERINEEQGEKQETAIEEGRMLLRQIAAHPRVMHMTKFLIDENKIKSALPDLPEAIAKKDDVAKSNTLKLHDTLSHYLLQVQDQLDQLDSDGKESLKMLEKTGPEIIALIEEKLIEATKLLDKKATAKTLKPTKLQLVDEMICYIIAPSTTATAKDKKIAKEYVNDLLKNVIALVIGNLTKTDPNQPVVEVFADVLNEISDKGETAIEVLITQSKSGPMTHLQVTQLAAELNITLSEEMLAPEKLTDTYEQLFLTKTAREILQVIISEEDFEKILPKFFRKQKDALSGPYESAAGIFVPQLQALYALRKKTIERPAVAIPQEFRELIAQGVETLKETIKKEKTAEEVQKERTEDKLKNALLNTKTASQFIDKTLPSILEAIAAHHITPTDTQTFEERTAELFLNFIEISQGGFDKIAVYTDRENKELSGKAWLHSQGYTQEAIDTYRKTNDIPENEPIEVETFLLYETTKLVVEKIFPKSLLEQILPEEWKSLDLDQMLVTMTKDYLRQTYECSQVAKMFGAPKVDPTMLKDLSSYLQKQIPAFLGSNDGKELSWMNNVINKVLLTENEAQKQLLAKFVSNAIYAGVTALFSSAKAPKEGDKEVNLINQFGIPARITQKYLLALNAYEVDKNREKLFDALFEKSTETKSTANKDKQLQAYFKTINKPYDEKTLDIPRFVYWLAARETLEAGYSDANWEKLVPPFLHKVATKDLAATFAISGYQLLHETQKLLQENEGKGRNIVSQYDGLDAFMQKNVLTPLRETLKELGEDSKPISDKLPPIVNTFAKQALLADPSTDMGSVRETVVERVVYSIAGKVFETSKHEYSKNIRDHEQSIQDLVDSHLDPYVNGKVTAETEDVNRKPLIETLFPKLQAKHRNVQFEKAEVEQFALKCYCDRAAKEFVSHFGRFVDPTKDDIAPYVEQLLHAIQIDFKELNLTPEQIIDLGKQALWDCRRGFDTTYLGGGPSAVTSPPFIQETMQVLETFKKGDHQATAKKLVATVMPAEIQETELTKFLISNTLPTITEYVSQIDESIKKVDVQSSVAKKYLEELDPTGGFNKFLKESITTVDKSIDDLCNEKEISKTLPPVVNELIHTFLEKPELQKATKTAVHSLIYISLQQVLTPVGGETIQERIEVFVNGLISSYDASDTKKTGAAWLEQIIPDKKRKELLPEFLHSMLTYANISKWVFEPYVKDVAKMESYVKESEKRGIDTNTERLQKYAKKEFQKQAAEKLSDYKGLVGELGASILKIFTSKGIVDKVLNALVGQFTEAATQAGMLHENYLTATLTTAIPYLNNSTVNPVDLPKKEDFNKAATEKLLNTFFPKGKESLPTEEFKDTAWKQMESTVEGVIQKVTQRDDRILFTLDSLIPMITEDKGEIKKRTEEVAALKKDSPSFMKESEKLVKSYILDAAMNAVDQKIEKTGWWAPFKWIAKAVVKSITYLFVAHSVRGRVWDFISSPETDMKMRRFIWVLLSPVKPEDLDKANKESLTEQCQSMLSDTHLVPWILRGFVSSSIADTVDKKTFVDLI